MRIDDISLLTGVVSAVRVVNKESFSAVEGFSIDSRTIKKGQVFVAVKGVHVNGHDFIAQAVNAGAGAVVAEYLPSEVSVPVFFVADSLKAMGDIAAYIRRVKKPFTFAITGSVGKTTTKEMLYFLLRNRFTVLKNEKTENNIYGVAKTLFSLQDEKVLIMELGTNAPGEIPLLANIVYPDVGVITFIKPVHLEKLKSLKGIYEEKSSLLRVNPDMKAVLNRDDTYLKKVDSCKEIYWYGMKGTKPLCAKMIESNMGTSVFLINGRHRLTLHTPMPNFIYNALAAMQAAMLMGVVIEDVIGRMNYFEDFPDSRMQEEKIGSLTVVNDSYNANPYAVEQALAAIKQFPLKKIVVLGDMFELGRKSAWYHEMLAKDVLKNNIDYCLLLGEGMKYLKDKLDSMHYGQAYHFASHDEIVDFIAGLTSYNTQEAKKYLLFLKGSRRMKLEKILELMRKNCTL